MMNAVAKIPVVILISGNGSNLQAIIDATHKDLAINIKAVVSNQAHAYGLMRAQQANIPTEIIPHQNYTSRDDFEQELRQKIDAYQPQLVILAGFMRHLGASFVAHYAGRMINIHPSLLPKHPGLHTHQRVLAAGDSEHGSTVHFVTNKLDAGPILAQAKLKVQPNDTEESLRKRILDLEHLLYPTVLSWFTKHRFTLHDEKIYKDGKLIDTIMTLPICPVK